MVANQIHIARPDPANQFPMTNGINVQLGDGASDFLFPTLLPIQYSVNNTARNISILSNAIQGNSNQGIFVSPANFGNSRN